MGISNNRQYKFDGEICFACKDDLSIHYNLGMVIKCISNLTCAYNENKIWCYHCDTGELELITRDKYKCNKCSTKYTLYFDNDEEQLCFRMDIIVTDQDDTLVGEEKDSLVILESEAVSVIQTDSQILNLFNKFQELSSVSILRQID